MNATSPGTDPPAATPAPASLPVSAPPSRLAAWLLATRPRTLAAGVVPVLVGTALAVPVVPISLTTAAACLIGSLLIQIATNFANDAFDALKGADGPDRLGPRRAVASGLISARAMLLATAGVLVLALLIGLHLASIGGWPILVLGVVSLICAVAYTGGPWPLAYLGLGDLFVFLFFGLFAVLGSYALQTLPSGHALITPGCILIAEAVGLQATGIIAVNNLRDRVSDARVGKRTLAVRLGDRGARFYIALLHGLAVLCLVLAAWSWQRPSFLVPAAIAALGGTALSRGVHHAEGGALNQYLARSAALELITGVCIAVVATLSGRCAAG
jgi:1,4-dihydroxy-2-naphthoate octaprenyltransferase